MANKIKLAKIERLEEAVLSQPQRFVTIWQSEDDPTLYELGEGEFLTLDEIRARLGPEVDLILVDYTTWEKYNEAINSVMGGE